MPNLQNQRVHIVGSGPRSGTTLLAEAMKVCFNFDVTSEHEESLCISNTELGIKSNILTKYPFEFDIIKRPLSISRSLYIICLIRDPRDTISSKHGAFPDTYWCSLRYWQYFIKYYDWLKSNSKVLLIKYEDLVTSPDEIQHKISAFLPFLSQVFKFSEFHNFANPGSTSVKALNGVRAIKPKGIGNWKHHLPRIKQQVSLHGQISSSLIKTGYEQDMKWTVLLDSVNTGSFKSKMDEYFPRSLWMNRRIREFIVVINILFEHLGLSSNLILDPMRKLYRYLARIS